MSVEIIVRPPFCEDWTSVSVNGPEETDITNILVSRLLTCDHEVMVEEGWETIPWEEADHGA